MPGSHDANIPLLIIAAGFIVFGWVVGLLAVRDYLRKEELKDKKFEEEYFSTHCRICNTELDAETGECARCQPREGVVSSDPPQ